MTSGNAFKPYSGDQRKEIGMQHIAMDAHTIGALVRGAAFSNAIKNVPAAIWDLGPDELLKCATPTQTDNALRCALWNELRLANQTNRSISPPKLYRGICTAAHFYAVIKNAAKLAWLTSPNTRFIDQADSIVDGLMRRYHDVLRLDLKNEDGSINTGVLKAVLAGLEIVMRHAKGERD